MTNSVELAYSRDKHSINPSSAFKREKGSSQNCSKCALTRAWPRLDSHFGFSHLKFHKVRSKLANEVHLTTRLLHNSSFLYLRWDKQVRMWKALLNKKKKKKAAHLQTTPKILTHISRGQVKILVMSHDHQFKYHNNDLLPEYRKKCTTNRICNHRVHITYTIW